MLSEIEPNRRIHNRSDIPEPHGRHRSVSDEKILEMDRILNSEGIEARGLT